MEDVTSRPAWRKSSHSGNDGAHCVELARLPEDIGVRDSKDASGPTLHLTRETFQALINDLKR